MKRWSNSEIDPRSKSKTENIKPIKNAVYLNILNEELDFIGRFENLLEDFGKVCSILNCKNKLPHSQYNKKTPKRYTEYYNDETQQIVAEKYAKDIEHFGYKFGE
jgi:tRNA A22 N-methylase